MDEAQEAKLRALAVRFLSSIGFMIIVSWILGINRLPGIVSLSAVVGIVLVYLVLHIFFRYRRMKSETTSEGASSSGDPYGR